METHEMVHAALEWAKSNGYAQRAREGAGGLTIDDLARAQARVQVLERDLRKHEDAYNIQQGDIEHKQRRIEQLEQELEKYREWLGSAEDEIGKANSEIYRLGEKLSEVERELGDITTERDNIHAHRNELLHKLNAAKDARIEAEREAADLRAWRRGLVKPKTVTPKKWPVCLQQSDGHVSYVGSPSYNQMKGVCWFDPRDIFVAADRDEEKENK